MTQDPTPPIDAPAQEATLIDGAGLARRLRAETRVRADIARRAGVVPRLAIVRAGDDPASGLYVRNKLRAAAETGIEADLHSHPGDVSQEQLLSAVAQLDADPAVHGIIVQLPLPKGIDPALVARAIDPDKDVDGLHPMNAGHLWDEREGYVPCTAAGIVRILEEIDAELDGARAVIIGRNHLVGRPLAILLTNRSATVTLCHSRTRYLGSHTRTADILVAAAGRPGLVTEDMVKPGAIVVDVGTNRLPDGRFVGDVDFAAVRRRAGWITPVPGGVGPMTVALLLHNTVMSALRRLKD